MKRLQFRLASCLLAILLFSPITSAFYVTDKPQDEFLEAQEKLLGVHLGDGQMSTHKTLLPAGHGVQVVLTPQGLAMNPLPPAGIPLDHDDPGAAGCTAIPGVTGDGWAPSPHGACESDVDEREWHDQGIQRLVFSTNGEGTGSVNAVNFPEPWDPERHGVFVLWCEFSGSAVLDTTQFFHYTEVTCGLIEIGLPLWEYDEWSSHVGAEGTSATNPDQVYATAVWE